MVKEALVYKAYRKVCNYDKDVHLGPENIDFVIRFLKEYQTLDLLDEFRNTTPIFYPFKSDIPRKKAKEIALEAAVACMGREATEITFDANAKVVPGTRLVAMAETIYQWLTEPETDQR